MIYQFRSTTNWWLIVLTFENVERKKNFIIFRKKKLLLFVFNFHTFWMQRLHWSIGHFLIIFNDDSLQNCLRILLSTISNVQMYLIYILKYASFVFSTTDFLKKRLELNLSKANPYLYCKKYRYHPYSSKMVNHHPSGVTFCHDIVKLCIEKGFTWN